jgi:hypothetical protein
MTQEEEAAYLGGVMADAYCKRLQEIAKASGENLPMAPGNAFIDAVFKVFEKPEPVVEYTPLKNPIVLVTPPECLMVGLCDRTGTEVQAEDYYRQVLGDWNDTLHWNIATDNWPEIHGWILVREGEIVWRSELFPVPKNVLTGDTLHVSLHISINDVPMKEFQKMLPSSEPKKKEEPEVDPLPTKRIVEI